MKKIFTFIAIMLIVLATIWGIKISLEINQCNLDNNKVCFDIETSHFLIEDNATILVRVPTQETKTQLEQLWKSQYPTKSTLLQIDVGSTIEANQVSTIGEDIFLLDSSHAALALDNLYKLDPAIMPIIAEQVNLSLAEDINSNHPVFITTFITGDTLITDITSLENNNLSLNNVTTFDNLFQHHSSLTENYEVIFPLIFNDFDTLYPLLTVDGWYPFNDFELDLAHLDSTEFLNGLIFIQTLGDYIWDSKNPTNNPNEFTWQYDTILANEKGPLSIYKPYVNMEIIEASTQHNYLFTAYPSYQQQTLTHLSSVQGWVMHKNTYYPSAGHEVLTFLRSPQAIEILTNTTNKTPAIHSNVLRTINIPLRQRQLALAHQQARTKPFVTTPANQNKLLWDVFTDINITKTIKDVYSQKLTPQQAQEEIVKQYQQWIEENR